MALFVIITGFGKDTPNLEKSPTAVITLAYQSNDVENVSTLTTDQAVTAMNFAYVIDSTAKNVILKTMPDVPPHPDISLSENVYTLINKNTDYPAKISKDNYIITDQILGFKHNTQYNNPCRLL